MNKLLADITVLYNKLHTMHYNVVGKDFYSMHVMLEGEYNQMHEWIDEVAESMKMNGVYPVATLKEVLELTEIKELEARDYKGEEVLTILLEDYKMLVTQMVELKEEAGLIQENLLDDMITYLTKQIWFIESTCK